MLLNEDTMGGLGAALTTAAREPILKLLVGAADLHFKLPRGAGATVLILVDRLTC
jgi:hypothetical protein